MQQTASAERERELHRRKERQTECSLRDALLSQHMFNNSQPHKPAKPQIALPMPVFEAPRKIRSLVNSRSVHPQFFTMIHRDHACCEQHRCLDYSSSTQTGCVSNETALFFFFFLSIPPPPGDGSPTFLLTRVQKWKKCVTWWCRLYKDSLSPPTGLDNEAW